MTNAAMNFGFTNVAVTDNIPLVSGGTFNVITPAQNVNCYGNGTSDTIYNFDNTFHSQYPDLSFSGKENVQVTSTARASVYLQGTGSAPTTQYFTVEEAAGDTTTIASTKLWLENGSWSKGPWPSSSSERTWATTTRGSEGRKETFTFKLR